MKQQADNPSTNQFSSKLNLVDEKRDIDSNELTDSISSGDTDELDPVQKIERLDSRRVEGNRSIDRDGDRREDTCYLHENLNKEIAVIKSLGVNMNSKADKMSKKVDRVMVMGAILFVFVLFNTVVMIWKPASTMVQNVERAIGIVSVTGQTVSSHR